MTHPRLISQDKQGSDHWPGFVDALATLLLVVIFLLALFAVAQYALGRTLSDRDAEVARLNLRLDELANILALEKTRADEATARAERLRATLTNERDQFRARIAALITERDDAVSAAEDAARSILALETDLEEQVELTDAARAEIALLNQQLAALNAQLAELNALLEESEARDREQRAEIQNLQNRLNSALARKAQELARFRSEFFQKIAEALGERADIRVVGDRFVFETDVLFASASAELSEEGKDQLRLIADAIKEMATEIPDDLEWIIRVDGHTDERPIRIAFRSNWHLSAERAISVVNFFQNEGVPPQNLVAAGFGEHQPIASGRTEEAYQRNRRIELKLDQR